MIVRDDDKMMYEHDCFVPSMFVYLSNFQFQVKVGERNIEETYKGWEIPGRPARAEVGGWGREGKVSGLRNYLDNFYFQILNIKIFQLGTETHSHMDKTRNYLTLKLGQMLTIKSLCVAWYVTFSFSISITKYCEARVFLPPCHDGR